MNILKQSTAATIKLGPFVDDTDGKTAETALTIGQADIRLSKNGGDIAQTHNATGATHDELGYYDIPLDTTDTGTLGRLRVLISKAGALPVWQDFVVVTANVYDSMFSTDKLDVAVVEMATDVLTAAAVKADAVTKIQSGLATPTNITAGTITTVTNLTNLPTMPTDWVTAAGLKADAVTEIQSGLATAAALDAVDNFIDTEVAAILAAVDTEVAAIKAKTDNLPASPAAVGSAMTLTAAYDKAKDDVLTPLAVVDGVVDGLKTTLDNIHDTDLPAVKTETAAILADTGTDGVVLANDAITAAKFDESTAFPIKSADAGSTLIARAGSDSYDLTDINDTLTYSGVAVNAIGDNVITATAVKADAVTKIQSGLATSAALDTVDANVDSILADTGTTIPATLATIAGYTDGIAGDVWSYKIRTLTNQLMSVATPAPGEPISMIKSVTNYLSFGSIGVMTDQDKLWITFKTNNDDADSSAIMQIEVTDGLIVLNGSSTLPSGITATEASITVDDASVGSITVRIDQLVADVLPTLEAYPIYFDIKQLLDDDVNLLYQGEAYIFATSTHTIS